MEQKVGSFEVKKGLAQMLKGGVIMDVVNADHAKIAEGPGGPAEMVPGKRHCKMKMYTAVAKGGNYEIVGRSNGLVDPKEC